MSIYQTPPGLSRRFQLIFSSFLQNGGLPFAAALPEQRIREVFAEEEADFAQDEDAIYTPAVTVWAWLSQSLFKDEQRSCLAAVARVVVLLTALGRKPCAMNCGAYCRACAKVPEVVLRRLTCEVAQGCEKVVPRDWLWHGRHVTLVDGTTASMPDTPANQEEYPQAASQKPGLGFPLVRLVLLLSLATGMVQGMALGPYAGKETGETALFRQLLGNIDPQTILLADRYYCSYFLLAMALLGKRDFVVRLHQGRQYVLCKTKQPDSGDCLVQWPRPPMPTWMDQATYEQMPASLRLRLVKVHVHERGFRARSLWVATTLDAQDYPAEEIAALYRRRWLAELDIRAIKQTMGMDVLRCQSPPLVRSEIWTCLLAYNLIRKAMLEAAYASGRSPRELSFAAAMQTIAASLAVLAWADEPTVARILAVQISSLAQQIVGNRPGRIEPAQ